MKSKLTVWAAVLLFLMIPASTVMAGGGKQSDEIVVAGIVHTEDQFMKLLNLGYQVAAKEEGVRLLLSNTAIDQAREVELINTYMAQKVNGLVIAPLSASTSVAGLRRAAESGMKVATTNIAIDDSSFLVAGYSSAQYNLGERTGEVAAQFIKNNLGGRARIAVVQFKSLFPEISADRVNGFLDAIKKVNPDVEVVADQDAWQQDSSVNVVGDMLTANRDINIVYGANDGGTIGAVMAVRNAGLGGKCFVYGIDIGEIQINMLRENDNILQAVTGQDPYVMGYNATKAVIDAARGKDVSATRGKNIIVPGPRLTRDDQAGIDAFDKDLKAKIASL
jgi:simple sugar transport system substrate-binding protein/ribose transport system substrate-binding protein